MPNYQNGKIYSIRSRSRPDLVYIGSTTRPLSERMSGHKKRIHDGCTSKQIIDLNDSYIELIESYPCANVEELHKREGHFQRSMECVNKCIAGRSSAEWYQDNCEHTKAKSRKYHYENREHVLKRSKQYGIKNREKISEKTKIYRDDHKEDYQQYCQLNKDKIAKQRNAYWHSKKEMRTCICGKSYNYGMKRYRLQHYQSQKHQDHIKLIYEKIRSF